MSVEPCCQIYFSGIANEKIFLRKRVDRLKGEKSQTLDKLDVVIKEKIVGFHETGNTQDSRLENVKDKVPRSTGYAQ